MPFDNEFITLMYGIVFAVLLFLVIANFLFWGIRIARIDNVGYWKCVMIMFLAIAAALTVWFLTHHFMVTCSLFVYPPIVSFLAFNQSCRLIGD